jgi:GTPase SAR1 family protein
MSESFKKSEERKIPAKVVLLGDSAAGKTSILLRFVQDEFCEDQRPIMGASSIKYIILFVKQAIEDVKLEIL